MRLNERGIATHECYVPHGVNLDDGMTHYEKWSESKKVKKSSIIF